MKEKRKKKKEVQYQSKKPFSKRKGSFCVKLNRKSSSRQETEAFTNPGSVSVSRPCMSLTNLGQVPTS